MLSQDKIFIFSVLMAGISFIISFIVQIFLSKPGIKRKQIKVEEGEYIDD